MKQADRMAKYEAQRKERELKLMQTPGEWPLRPWLPLKRKSRSGAFPECAMMKEGEGAVVIKDNEQKEGFLTIEAMYDAGWRID